MSTHATNTPANLHRVKLVKNHNHVRDGKKAYGHLLRKYGFKPVEDYPFQVVDEVVEDDSTNRLQKWQERIKGNNNHVTQQRLKTLDSQGQVGQVSAQDVQNDSEYLAQVWSTQLPSSTQTQGKSSSPPHNIFDQSKSTTFKTSGGQKWNITYGDGSSASGTVGTDVVNVGGLTIQNQAVELANKMSSTFVSGPGDGLFGLAFDSTNTVTPNQVQTPVGNMIAQSAIQPSAELFTAYLGSYKDANDPDKGQSFYTFGFIDNDPVTQSGQPIWYTPVDNSNGFWQFPSTSCVINGTTYPLSGNTAIADTGTTLALVDSQTCKNIYAAIPGSSFSKTYGGYVFPSTTAESALPVVAFDVGGKTFAVNKEDLAYSNVGNGLTYGGIQSRGTLPFSIFGDTFLKCVYAIFDVGNTRFGVVPRPEQTSTTQSNTGKHAPGQQSHVAHELATAEEHDHAK